VSLNTPQRSTGISPWSKQPNDYTAVLSVAFAIHTSSGFAQRPKCRLSRQTGTLASSARDQTIIGTVTPQPRLGAIYPVTLDGRPPRMRAHPAREPAHSRQGQPTCFCSRVQSVYLSAQLQAPIASCHPCHQLCHTRQDGRRLRGPGEPGWHGTMRVYAFLFRLCTRMFGSAPASTYKAWRSWGKGREG